MAAPLAPRVPVVIMLFDPVSIAPKPLVIDPLFKAPTVVTASASLIFMVFAVLPSVVMFAS